MTSLVATFNTRTRRFVAVGAFTLVAGAAAIAPALISTTHTGADVTAAPACLAWFGNKEDGKCLSYSNGAPIGAGIGPVGIGAPGSGSPGLTTGPMLPGTSINRGIG
ncbi:hypothetical protein M2272_001493 [Mycobacterium frederiksbergense]|uniref:Intersectin-EH binding protein Ibp1 n=1 Tax=Mycolicibacterium frederiksbergense TaxID=117567 RepID=A0ABT6KVX0_9MYCO|nr:hypothetical protein [Mycolicibacterium frederiksbergense]MDH6194864.1 hypothetical protein [Mycolicibacterium frederiksbergense]